MRHFLRAGRTLLALALLGFGALYLCVLAGRGVPHIGPPFLLGTRITTIAMGLLLIAAAAGLLMARSAGVVALLVGLGGIACAGIVYAPRVLRALHDPGPWTSGAEMLALGAGALAMAGVSLSGGRGTGRALFRLGELLFALANLVFGVQHFLYGRFVANLLLPWMPWHLFWAYFVGVAFVAAGLALLVNVQGRLAAGMLGLMFSLWVIFLHGPLVWSHLHDGNLWTSGLVALAMAGCSFGVAAGAER